MAFQVGYLAPFAALAACAPTPVIPPPPGWLELPASYTWGDPVAGQEERLARYITAGLKERYGPATETHAIAADPAALGRLRDWYRSQLADWTPLELSMVQGETAFGWSQGDSAIVIGAIAPQPDGRVPVTIFRFEGPAKQ